MRRSRLRCGGQNRCVIAAGESPEDLVTAPIRMTRRYIDLAGVRFPRRGGAARTTVVGRARHKKAVPQQRSVVQRDNGPPREPARERRGWDLNPGAALGQPAVFKTAPVG